MINDALVPWWTQQTTSYVIYFMPGSEFRVNSVNGLQTITDLQQIREYYKNTNISVKFIEQFNNIFVNALPNCSKNQFYNTKSICNNF